MRTSILVVAFSALAVSNVIARPMYDDMDLQEREYIDTSLETRSRHHDGPTISVHFRELMEELDARFDLDEFAERDFLAEDITNLESRSRGGGFHPTINIHLRELVDEMEELDSRLDLDEFVERDFLGDDITNLESRSRGGGFHPTVSIHLRDLAEEMELAERNYFDDADELDARSAYADDDDLEAREFDDFELGAREDEVEMEAREPMRHFRVGTVILPSSNES